MAQSLRAQWLRQPPKAPRTPLGTHKLPDEIGALRDSLARRFGFASRLRDSPPLISNDTRVALPIGRSVEPAGRLAIGRHVAAFQAASSSAASLVSVAGRQSSFSGRADSHSLHRSFLAPSSVASSAARSGSAVSGTDVAADVSGICRPEFAAELAAAVDVVERACHVCVAVREQMVAAEQGGYSSGSESDSSMDKTDRSPVTVADFAVQALATLELAQQFPGTPLVGEEDASLLRADMAARITQAAADVDAAVAAPPSRAAAGAAFPLPSLAERVTDLVHRFASPHAVPSGGGVGGALEEAGEGREAAVEAVLGAIDAAAAATHELEAAAGATARHKKYWVVDPIDGTRGFLKGQHNQYAVGLALIEDGEVVLSALGLPNMPLPRGASSASISSHAADVEGSAAAREAGGTGSESGNDMWQKPRGVILAASKGGGTWMRRLHYSSTPSVSDVSSAADVSIVADSAYHRLHVDVGVRNLLAHGTTHAHSVSETHPLSGSDGSHWDDYGRSSSHTGRSHSSSSSSSHGGMHESHGVSSSGHSHSGSSAAMPAYGAHSASTASSGSSSTTTSSSSALCVCISDHEVWPSLPLAKGLEAAAPHASQITVLPLCCGSLCKYAAVALGHAAVFIQHPLPGSPQLKVWDHAAGVLCVTEAGGQVTDFAGQLLAMGGVAGTEEQEDLLEAASEHSGSSHRSSSSSSSHGSLAHFEPHGGGVVATNGVLHSQVLHHLSIGLRMRRG
ncbi:hypothetical protein CLOM_g6352 [Closterium sp. NIES-68]|nr:hypothetical protein CLOM_g6352 [Closterium sp. NIES-68]GJP64724.1 hypothetical protein CLOP_g21682 [Closterium sp. NIES-67]